MSGASDNNRYQIDHPEYISIYVRILAALEETEDEGANLLGIMAKTFLTNNAAVTHLAWLEEKGLVSTQIGKSVFVITGAGKSWLQSHRGGEMH